MMNTVNAPAAAAISAKPKKEGMLKQSMKRLAKDKMAMIGLVGIVLLILLSIFGPMLTPYTPDDMDLLNMNSGPTAVHPMGTDALGRDYMTRLFYGGRYSLVLGFGAALLSLFIGIMTRCLKLRSIYMGVFLQKSQGDYLLCLHFLSFA